MMFFFKFTNFLYNNPKFPNGNLKAKNSSKFIKLRWCPSATFGTLEPFTCHCHPAWRGHAAGTRQRHGTADVNGDTWRWNVAEADDQARHQVDGIGRDHLNGTHFLGRIKQCKCMVNLGGVPLKWCIVWVGNSLWPLIGGRWWTCNPRRLDIGSRSQNPLVRVGVVLHGDSTVFSTSKLWLDFFWVVSNECFLNPQSLEQKTDRISLLAHIFFTKR